MTDWDYSKAILLGVSRSFAKPIELLGGDLERATTVGYLLCRLVDTIEDHPTLPTRQRDQLYAAFLEVVECAGDPARFVGLVHDLLGPPLEDEGDELALARNLPRVMRVFGALPEPMQAAIRPWVAEMARGMAIYSHRPVGVDGDHALETVADLERYCYFVAGTVGHMLTGLFLAALGDVAPARRQAMRRYAESFGLGLQLVNILKDVTDDAERRWFFIPRDVCAEQGLAPRDLLDPARRAAAHRALAPIFEVAHRALAGALEYTLALPADALPIRHFCLLPLWMAIRTLVLAKGNDDQVTPGRPVKIARDEVGTLLGECLTLAADDAGLRAAFARLSVRP